MGCFSKILAKLGTRCRARRGIRRHRAGRTAAMGNSIDSSKERWPDHASLQRRLCRNPYCCLPVAFGRPSHP